MTTHDQWPPQPPQYQPHPGQYPQPGGYPTQPMAAWPGQPGGDGPPPNGSGPRKTPRAWKVPTGVGVATFILGAAIGASGSSDTTANTAATGAQPAQTVTVTGAASVQPPVTVTVTQKAAAPAATSAAPKPKPTAAPAIITDGTWTVGQDFPAGKYRVTEPIADAGVGGCYWAITKSGSNGNDIIANDIPAGGRPQVTLKKGQDFETQSCGEWAKVG